MNGEADTKSDSPNLVLPNILKRSKRDKINRSLPAHEGPFLVGTCEFEVPALEPKIYGPFKGRHNKEISLPLETLTFRVFYPTSLTRKTAQDYYRPHWLAEPKWQHAKGYAGTMGAGGFVSSAAALAVWQAVNFTKLVVLEGAPIVPADMLVHTEIGADLLPAEPTSPSLSDHFGHHRQTTKASPGEDNRHFRHQYHQWAIEKNCPLQQHEKAARHSVGRDSQNAQNRAGYKSNEWPMPKELPTIVFSHGLSGNPRIYSHICGQWSSFGFIVISVEHKDGTGPMALVDPDRIPAGAQKCTMNTTKTWTYKDYLMRTNPHRYIAPVNSKYFGKHVPDWYSATDPTLILRRGQLEFRVAEIKQIFQYLEKLNAGELKGTDLTSLRNGKGKFQDLKQSDQTVLQFKGRLDLTGNLVMAGHSFGGATTTQILRETSTNPATYAKMPFKCGLLLDPWTEPIPGISTEDQKNVDPPSADLRYHVPDVKGVNLCTSVIRAPVIAIASTLFAHWADVTPWTKVIARESAKGPVGKAVLLEVKGSTHLNQSDMCLLFNKFLLAAPFSAMHIDARRCMDINVKATFEFMREILPLDYLPLPRIGGEEAFVPPEGLSLNKKHKRMYYESRNDRILHGDCKDVIIHYQAGFGKKGSETNHDDMMMKNGSP